METLIPLLEGLFTEKDITARAAIENSLMEASIVLLLATRKQTQRIHCSTSSSDSFIYTRRSNE